MHTINRNNYETWLMLYLDNELTATERKAVEAFCTSNPDVQEELDGLKEVLLQPDLPVAMPGKERLLMPEIWNEEALTRQQQQLLMLADNALPEGDKVLLENEMEADPLLQKEWSVLQKTVLAASVPAEMPGKENLYKRENARMIPFGRILRIAAAAAILGFGWFFTQGLLTNNKADRENPAIVVAGKKDANQGQTGNNQGVVAVLNDSAVEENSKGQKEIAAVTLKESPSVKTKKDNLVKNENSSVEAPRDIVLANNSIENNAELTNRGNVTKIPSVTFVDVNGVDDIEPPVIAQTVKVETARADMEPKAMQIHEVVNADDVDADESISIAGARISKQKIRNVYRNITRPLARTFEKTPAPRTEIR